MADSVIREANTTPQGLTANALAMARQLAAAGMRNAAGILSDLTVEIDRLTSTANGLYHEVADLYRLRNDMNARLLAEVSERQKAQQLLMECEAGRRAERERTARVEKELDNLTGRLNGHITAAGKLQQENSGLRDQIAQLTKDVELLNATSLAAAHAALAEQVHKLEAEVARLTAANLRQEAELNNFRSDRGRRKQESAALQQDRAVALVAAANYERLWKEEKARREDLEKTVGGLRGDLGKSMEEVHQLEERLKKSKEYRDQNIHVERQAQKQVAEENRQLREENRQLREEKAKLRAQFRENWANVDRQVADLRESFAASQKVHAHCEAELRQALSDLLAASLFVSDDLLSRTLKVLGRKV